MDHIKISCSLNYVRDLLVIVVIMTIVGHLGEFICCRHLLEFAYYLQVLVIPVGSFMRLNLFKNTFELFKN